jgi:hypothetical protein
MSAHKVRIDTRQKRRPNYSSVKKNTETVHGNATPFNERNKNRSSKLQRIDFKCSLVYSKGKTEASCSKNVIASPALTLRAQPCRGEAIWLAIVIASAVKQSSWQLSLRAKRSNLVG